jgi:diguanylate cyclase (GGDEF)-like protein
VARKEPARNKSFSVEDLLRENAGLRHELAKLEGYRTLAYRDDLTDLWNRRYFSERLAEEISRARRRPQRYFTIMMVDVNDLKALNDSYGHQEGDLVLRWVAEFLERSLRAHDVICRVGGDEFAVLLPEIDAQPAAALLARLRSTLATARTGAPYSIGLSFGLAAYPDDGKTCDELVHVADNRMYRDKQRQKLAPTATPLPGPKRASARS